MLAAMKAGLVLIVVLVFSAPIVFAQEDDVPIDEPDLAAEIDELRQEVKRLREQIDNETLKRERESTMDIRALTIYGDIGLRWPASC